MSSSKLINFEMPGFCLDENFRGISGNFGMSGLFSGTLKICGDWL